MNKIEYNSQRDATLYFLKINVGTGLMALPAAVKDAGLVGGALGIVAVGLANTLCLHILVSPKNIALKLWL